MFIGLTASSQKKFERLMYKESRYHELGGKTLDDVFRERSGKELTAEAYAEEFSATAMASKQESGELRPTKPLFSDFERSCLIFLRICNFS